MGHHQLPNSSRLGLSLYPRSQGTPQPGAGAGEPSSCPGHRWVPAVPAQPRGPGGRGLREPLGCWAMGQGRGCFKGLQVPQLGDAALEGSRERWHPQAKWLLRLP